MLVHQRAIPNRCWKGRTCMQPYGSSLRTSFDLDELHIQPRERQSAISFKATVSVSEVPHLGQTELKRDLWWTPETSPSASIASIASMARPTSRYPWLLVAVMLEAARWCFVDFSVSLRGHHLSTGGHTARASSRVDKQPHPANVEGDFYVDHTCIDCDTCRWMAPDTFGRTGAKGSGQSYVYQQPQGPGPEQDLALQAMISCPTGSIRTRAPLRKTREILDTFPLRVAERLPNVFHLGFHSKHSFGAASYFVKANSATEQPLNIMFDSPRYSSKLANLLEAAGGVDLMVMSHKDDVADHNRWKERFPQMRRVMHSLDVRGPDAWPYIDMMTVEEQLEGDGPWTLAEGVRVVHTPGHSLGSICLLLASRVTGGDPAIFTGDHLAFNGRLGRLDGFARYGDDLLLQAESMRKLEEEDFLWILPGHGRRVSFASAAERRTALTAAAEAFRVDPQGVGAPGPVFQDFQAFLKIRIALANEYKEAVKEKRLRASGSWDIQDPTLKQESRRGLGLGRMKLRQNNTRAYLAAVVNEQSRQRRECNWSHSIVLDDAKLADVGRRISESDVKASIERAQRDYASVRKENEEKVSKPFEKARAGLWHDSFTEAVPDGIGGDGGSFRVSAMGSPEKESHCQYFVLSPEVEHREVRKVDENTDLNVARTVVKISKVKKAPLSAKKPVVTPAVRPSTPTRGRPNLRKGEAKTPGPLTARSPITPKTEPPVRAPLTARTPTAPRTPKVQSPRQKCLEEDDLTASVCSGHFSVYSEASGHSRLTQLSRKSFSKRILSSKEIEEMEVMEKRRELTAMMHRNQLNCRKALHGTDLSSAGRKQSNAKLTEPKELPGSKSVQSAVAIA
eukprot:s350_g29.t2